MDTCISVLKQSVQLDMANIGTDGSFTVIGCHSGVVTHLKTITPSAIGVHCEAHTLNSHPLCCRIRTIDTSQPIDTPFSTKPSC